MLKRSFGLAFVFICVLISGCATSGSNNRSAQVDVFWDTALLQNVTRLTDDGLQKYWATISPDGTKMLYCEENEDTDSWGLMLLRDVNVPAKTPLVNSYAYAPAWYENNANYLFVSTESGDARIVRSAISGGGRTFVTRNSVGNGDSKPEVRGEAILFDTTGQGGRRQIYSMKDNGTEVTMLGEGWSPSWHPTEAKFIFVRGVGEYDSSIYEMDMATLQVTQLFYQAGNYCEMPRYSADGQHILFQMDDTRKRSVTITEKIAGLFKKSSTDTFLDRRWHIYTMKADGTNLSPLTSGDVDAYSPSWDINNFVYFISNAGGSSELYRARVNLE